MNRTTLQEQIQAAGVPGVRGTELQSVFLEGWLPWLHNPGVGATPCSPVLQGILRAEMRESRQSRSIEPWARHYIWAPPLLTGASPRSTKLPRAVILRAMAQAHSPLDSLWSDYRDVFRNWDDLTLARWLAQTLGQFEGRAWRMSHPLMGAYRLAAQLAHDRQIWFKRLATPPIAYTESPCCRAPMLPLLTRDVLESGLICPHCDEPMLAAKELPEECRPGVLEWAKEYAPVHAVAHWDDRQRKASGDYDRAFENAARDAEALLARAGTEVALLLLDHYPAVVWEDQDECLEVRPEDVKP